jgi:hypothetical protein
VKQEVNGTVILPPLVFPAETYEVRWVLSLTAILIVGFLQMYRWMGVREEDPHDKKISMVEINRKEEERKIVKGRLNSL